MLTGNFSLAGNLLIDENVQRLKVAGNAHACVCVLFTPPSLHFHVISSLISVPPSPPPDFGCSQVLEDGHQGYCMRGDAKAGTVHYNPPEVLYCTCSNWKCSYIIPSP